MAGVRVHEGKQLSHREGHSPCSVPLQAGWGGDDPGALGTPCWGAGSTSQKGGHPESQPGELPGHTHPGVCLGGGNELVLG